MILNYPLQYSYINEKGKDADGVARDFYAALLAARQWPQGTKLPSGMGEGRNQADTAEVQTQWVSEPNKARQTQTYPSPPSTRSLAPTLNPQQMTYIVCLGALDELGGRRVLRSRSQGAADNGLDPGNLDGRLDANCCRVGNGKRANEARGQFPGVNLEGKVPGRQPDLLPL